MFAPMMQSSTFLDRSAILRGLNPERGEDLLP